MPGDPARLLSSRPESRGLHPAGALTRPREEEDKVVAGRSGPTAQQSARISGATPSGCAGAPPRRLQTREKFCPAASSRQKRKRRKRALQDASPPGRSSLTGRDPPSSTRGLEGYTQRVRRRTPRAPSRAGCLRQTPPRLHENQCELLTRIFLHHASTDNPERCSGAISAFYYSCITVRPGASQSWPGGWPLGLRR